MKPFIKARVFDAAWSGAGVSLSGLAEGAKRQSAVQVDTRPTLLYREFGGGGAPKHQSRLPPGHTYLATLLDDRRGG